MANIIRLINGSKIQVRTGVLQGVGPQGPTGPIGPPGNDGPAGPPGEVGATGQILQIQAGATLSNTTVANGGLLSWSANYDDFGAFISGNTIRLIANGDYLFSVWAGFGNEDSKGSLSLNLVAGAVTQHRAFWEQSAAGVSLNACIRVTGGQEFQFVAATTTPLTVNAGRLTISRVGSGPVGPQGPQGPQGPIGAVGPVGPQGPQGNANGGFQTYADLR